MKWEFNNFIVVSYPDSVNDSKPVVHLDFANCDGPDYKVMGNIMAQTMRTAGIVFNGCWDSDEDNMIAWAESAAQEIFEMFYK
jgi:hypothetical protein